MGTSDSEEDSGVGSIDSALLLQAAADGHFRCFTVLIDGKHAGEICRGETKRYSLAPGKHDLVMRTEIGKDYIWRRLRSPRISFVVKPDADCEVACGSNLRSGKSAGWAFVMISVLLGGPLFLLVGEIQNAWFPQPFIPGHITLWLATPLGALINFLISVASIDFARFIVYERDGPVWCKLK